MLAKSYQIFFCTLLVLVSANLCGAKEVAQPTVNDFRYIYTLSGEAGASLYRVSVPASVYRQSQLPNLQDLRVFDSLGAAMPMYISDVPDVVAAEERTYPVFHMRVAEEGIGITLLGGQVPVPSQQRTATEADSTTKRREADAILCDFTQIRHGLTDLRLIPKAAALPRPIRPNTPTEMKVSGRLDGAQEQPLATGQSTGQSTVQAGYVVSVKMFTGSDMVTWRYEGLRTFGQVYTAGQLLELLALDLSTQERYVLLVPVEGATLFGVQGVSGTLHTREKNMHTVAATSEGWDDKAGGYLYTLPPSLPVRSLSLYLPSDTWLLHADILTRSPHMRKQRGSAAENSPWQTRTSGVFYAMRIDGARQTSEPVAFSPTWLRDATKPNLLLRPKGAAWDTAPQVDVRFEDQELYFMATGPGPFRLAIGASVPLAGAADPAVKKALDPKDTNYLFIGEMREQAVTSDEQTGQKVFIWGALLLGALCMGAIALRMLRSQRASTES